MSKVEDKRLKAACARCRARKTKCSGDSPCSNCLVTRSECLYPRKPKKIKVIDTEYEQLQSRVKDLEKELMAAKQIKNDATQTLNLSVFLSSPSSELVCWNLVNFMNNSFPGETFTITPDFNSFIEESIFDNVLFNSRPGDTDEVKNLLRTVSYKEVKSCIDTVVNFINIGYLTISPVEFEKSLSQHYDKYGEFIEDNNELYFMLKMLMVLALGNVYHEKNSVGYDLPSVDVPGLEYFTVVARNLPSNFQLMNLSKKNLKATFDVIELYGLVCIYFRILDKKSASCFFSLIALQLCISINLHKDSMLTKNSENMNLSQNFNSSNIFWSTYCMNRFACVRTAQPLLLSFKDISLQYADQPDEKSFHDAKIYMKFYIGLAELSEMINVKVYNTSYNSKDYLNTIFNILSLLQDWSNSIPDFLKLDFTNESFSFRTLSSLHLNYLHHVHLTCIPIFLNFAKFKIMKFKSTGVINHLNMKKLPKNIENLVIYSIQSAQSTINIFTRLIEIKLLRAFGFTDLDYIFSTAMVSVICLILNFEKDQLPTQNFESNLTICANLMKLMEDMGNSIAGAKLSQIVRLVESLQPLFDHLNLKLSFVNPTDKATVLPDVEYTEADNQMNEYFSLTNEDLDFIDALLHDYDNILN